MNAWEEFFITFIKEGFVQIWRFLLPILIPATIFGFKKVLAKFDIDLWQWKFEYHQNKDTVKNSSTATHTGDILATTAAVSSIDSGVKLQNGEQLKREDKVESTLSLCNSIAISSRHKREMNILLLGKTGEGKSSTGNTIIGCNSFEMSADKESKTKEVSMELAEIDGVTIKIVDTPGIYDAYDSEEVTLQNIFTAMTMCPSGFDALLYVISYTGRFTTDAVNTLNKLRRCFGERFQDNCIIVLTHGVNFDLDGNQNVEEWCKRQTNVKGFTEALELCQKRIVLFYNKVCPGDALKQKMCVDQLLNMIQQFPGRYKNDDFEKCSIEREKLMLEGKLTQLTLEIEEKISLLKTELKKAAKDIKNLDDRVIRKLQERISTVITEIQKQQGKTGLLEKYLDKARLIEGKVKQLSDNKENVLELLEEIDKLTEKLKNPPDRKRMFFKYAIGTAGSVALGAISVAVPAVGVITSGIVVAAGVSSIGASVGTVIKSIKDRKKYESDVDEYMKDAWLLLEKKRKLNFFGVKEVEIN